MCIFSDSMISLIPCRRIITRPNGLIARGRWIVRYRQHATDPWEERVFQWKRDAYVFERELMDEWRVS